MCVLHVAQVRFDDYRISLLYLHIYGASYIYKTLTPVSKVNLFVVVYVLATLNNTSYAFIKDVCLLLNFFALYSEI